MIEAFEERTVHVTSGGFVVLMYIRTSNTMEVNEVTSLISFKVLIHFRVFAHKM